MHRWFIPALGGQVDAVPGKTSETWFRADREGVYQGQSTFFAGSAYAVMRAWVRVVSPAAYEEYVRQKEAGAGRGPGRRPAEGHRDARRGDRGRDPARHRRPAPPRGRHRGDPASPGRLDRASDQHGPQVGGDPLPRDLAVLRRHRGDRAGAPEGAADRSREHGDQSRHLRPGPVRVRGHGGDPVRDPAGPGAARLHRPASDRLARGRLPAPQPALVLALRGRGDDGLCQLPVEAGRHRPGGAAAAVGADLLRGRRRRRLDRRLGARDPGVRLLRDQPRGHAPQHARARDGLAASAPAVVGGRGRAATCCSPSAR